MTDEEQYMPISCTFYDYLEEAATLGTIATITYWSNEKVVEVKAKIITLIIKEKIEYMILDNSTSIRLDTIISFNGNQLSMSC